MTRGQESGMNEPIAVVICDPDHPHAGERGELTGEVIRLKNGPGDGTRMAHVRLIDCQHGTDACYVSKGQIRQDRRTR